GRALRNDAARRRCRPLSAAPDRARPSPAYDQRLALHWWPAGWLAPQCLHMSWRPPLSFRWSGPQLLQARNEQTWDKPNRYKQKKLRLQLFLESRTTLFKKASQEKGGGS